MTAEQRPSGPAGPDATDVAVVIPTVGRSSVHRSVTSALAQERPPREVIVVFDGPESGTGALELPDDDRVRVLATGRRGGASAARALAIRSAQAPLIAFMDDDDVWLPAKLRVQVAEYERLRAPGVEPIVSCRTEVFDAAGKPRSASPRHVYRTGEDVGDYLFQRRDLIHTGYGFGSVTVLCSRALLERVPVRSDLRLHEDWDWVLRASRSPGVVVSMLPDVLATYWEQAAAGSASRPPKGWDASRTWAEQAGLSRTALGDFLLCVSAANALAYGETRQALKLAVRAARTARPSLRGWATFAVQVALPGPVAAKAAGIAQTLRPTRVDA